jgi:hypothetical protein
MTEPPTLTPIHVAIPRIIGDLPAIGKDSEMKDGPRYSYRGIDDIMPHIKQLFARHGVHVTPVYEIVSDAEILVGKYDTKMTRAVVKGMFRFTANDGSSVVAQTIGEARDAGDKAYTKAMTSSFKYAILEVFAIAGGDDPDDYRPELVGAAAAAPTPNYDRLAELGPKMKAAGVADAVKAWAKAANIDLRRGHDDELLADVIAYAEDQLRPQSDVAPGPPPVPEPIKPDTDVVAQARKELDEVIARGVEGEPAVAVEDVDTTDPLARIMDQFGPGAEVVEGGES